MEENIELLDIPNFKSNEIELLAFDYYT